MCSTARRGPRCAPPSLSFSCLYTAAAPTTTATATATAIIIIFIVVVNLAVSLRRRAAARQVDLDWEIGFTRKGRVVYTGRPRALPGT